jgi:hypothetical protein
MKRSPARGLSSSICKKGGDESDVDEEWHKHRMQQAEARLAASTVDMCGSATAFVDVTRIRSRQFPVMRLAARATL